MKINYHDNIQKLSQESYIYIYGSGTFARSFYHSIKVFRPDIRILGFINSNETGKIYGIPIIFVDNFNQKGTEYDNIIVCTDQAHWKEIVDKLNENKLDNFLINTYWDYDVFGKKDLNKYKKYESYFDRVRDIFSKERDILVWDMLTSSMKLQNINNLLQFDKIKQKVSNYDAYINLLKGDVVINGGASFGSESIYFEKQVGSEGLVYAFDPNIDSGSENSECIKSIPQVLWSKSTSVHFRLDGSRSMIVESGNGDIKVSAITIDDFAEKKSLNTVDLIKLDVEGAEIEVLSGATEVIKKFRPILAISIYHKFEHFFEIPLLINDLVQDYTFHIECFNSYAIDTMFFAVPNEKNKVIS
jgi:FkbM family methyltransferase